MCHYLRELDFEVTILACDAWGVLPDDSDLGIERVQDLRSIPQLRGLLRRGELQSTLAQGSLERPPSPLLTQVVVPDLHAVSWLPMVVRRVREMVSRGEMDCLVTSSPPQSVHLVGLLLGVRRPAWIADFRDGWRFHDSRKPFPTSAQKRFDAWLERRVAQRADLAVGATAPIASDLSTRLGAIATCVPNGWDPRLSPPATSPVTQTGDIVTLVHTGTLSGTRNPEPLLRALRAVQSDPEAAPLRLLHAGPLTTTERELIDATGTSDIVEHLGTLSRADALALQRSADALILLTSRNSSEATSKIFEYLAAGRPIVALAEGNEAERIVRETNTGVTVPPDDVGAIEAALRQARDGKLAKAYGPHGLERFEYPGPAEAMSHLIDEAIRRRRCRHSR